MGHEVSLKSICAGTVMLCVWPAAASAQANPVEPSHAVGVDLSYSSDADDTEVLKVGLNLDWRYRGPEEYQGIRLEKVRFSPLGQANTTDERIYLRLADRLGEWKYRANIGTDGETLLGSASINDESRFRKELFVEREKIETPQGVHRPITYTYAGAAIDLPLDERNVVTVLGGLQAFTGDNLRKHLRMNFVHVVRPELGLSVQLRTRAFRNSTPGEFDYFSPRWYAEVLPVVQLRRFSSGWRYLAAAGWGVQRDSGSKWRQSRYLNLRAASPARKGWALNGDLTYSNMPITDSPAYDYLQFSLGITRAF